MKAPRSTSPFRVQLPGGLIVGERTSGAGVPLVMLHGFGGSHADWRLVVDHMVGERPTVQYDLRGFGSSDRVDGVGYSHADDLLTIMDYLEIERADLCGLSLGGATALNFALDHPERMEHLILVSPLMAGWSWTAEWVERWKTIGRAARSGDLASAREMWWQHPLFDTLRDRASGETMHTSIEAFHGKQWVSDDQRSDHADADRLALLTPPTLLLTGEHDTEDFRQIADVISARGRIVTPIDYHNAGHMLNLEIPALIAADIERFLAPPSAE